MTAGPISDYRARNLAYALRTAGLGPSAIAQKLAALGYDPGTGRTWNEYEVRKLLETVK